MIFGTLSRRMLGMALVAGVVGACDFVESTATNPNQVPTATVDQLFPAIQVNTYLFAEGNLSRIAAMWMQQMAGTDRQFTALDVYDFNEEDADGEFSSVYTGGGLVDLHKAIDLAEGDGRRVFAGILKIHEAYIVGMAASLWGDIPYSEAVSRPEITTPKLDDQADVYASVQALLDEALDDLASAAGRGPGTADFTFGGDAGAWARVAHSLKARFYMHWAEVDPSNFARALAEAQLGIDGAAGDWVAFHSAASTEESAWAQFIADRQGYISAGEYLVNLLNGGTPTDMTDDDPRLPVYFTTGAADFEGAYIGSPPGEPAGDPGTNASQISQTGVGAPDYAFPILTCAETQFIIAEAAYEGADPNTARDALSAALACEEARLDVDLPEIDPALAGAALYDEIMTQKYIALFLGIEAWNDYKRTCRPAITPADGAAVVPGRLYYGQGERQTNPNIPTPNQQDQNPRNDNDPNACP